VPLARQAIQLVCIEMLSLLPDDLQEQSALSRDAMLRGVQRGFQVRAFDRHSAPDVIDFVFRFRLWYGHHDLSTT
jgi:hypothetical protein